MPLDVIKRKKGKFNKKVRHSFEFLTKILKVSCPINQFWAKGGEYKFFAPIKIISLSRDIRFKAWFRKTEKTLIKAIIVDLLDAFNIVDFGPAGEIY